MMYYCTRPHCPSPKNHFPDSPDPHNTSEIVCKACGMPLILRGKRGPYQTINSLGSGGFGSTFQAIDLYSQTNPKRQCVIKRLDIKPGRPDGEVKEIKKAFDREARVLELLGDRSGSIPTLYDYFSLTTPLFGQQERLELTYLVQQYIEGENLHQELTRKGRFSEPEILDFLEQILPVLQVIHGQNCIHRDIKPSNIVRETATQRLFLIDFGAVKQVVAGETDIRTAIVFNTPQYASPEQRKGTDVYPSSDLYSLAVTCLVLVTGKSPVLDTDYPNWPQHISPPLAKILNKMLEEKPRYRYQSAKDVLDAVNAVREVPQPVNQSSGTTRIVTPSIWEKLKRLLIKLDKSVFLVIPIIIVIVGVIGINWQGVIQLSLTPNNNNKLSQTDGFAQTALDLIKNAKNVTALEQAKTNFETAIKILESIPVNSHIDVQVQQKLSSYKTQLAELSERISEEQKAQTLLTEAKKIAELRNEELEEYQKSDVKRISELNCIRSKFQSAIGEVEKIITDHSKSLAVTDANEIKENYEDKINSIDKLKMGIASRCPDSDGQGKLSCLHPNNTVFKLCTNSQ
jgi:serine/threonine protein kinase